MRKILLAVLVVLALEHAPVRLMAVTAQALVMPGGYIRLSGGTDRYWDAQNVQLYIERMGWTVETVPGLREQGVYGQTIPPIRTIRIDAQLSWNDRLSVLAHEGGHMLQPPVLTTAQGEIFAESVAVLVVGGKHREHARYLSMWRADLLMTTLVYWPEMYRAAARLRGR